MKKPKDIFSLICFPTIIRKANQLTKHFKPYTIKGRMKILHEGIQVFYKLPDKLKYMTPKQSKKANKSLISWKFHMIKAIEHSSHLCFDKNIFEICSN